MFGSMILTGFLNAATEPGARLTIIDRTLLTASGIALYAAVLCLVFYLTLPEYRPTMHAAARNAAHAIRHRAAALKSRLTHATSKPIPIRVRRDHD